MALRSATGTMWGQDSPHTRILHTRLNWPHSEKSLPRRSSDDLYHVGFSRYFCRWQSCSYPGANECGPCGIGSPVAAATISFGVGFVALLTVTLFSSSDLSLPKHDGFNKWLLLGGLLGAFYVWAILWAVPTLGVLTAISAMILGQVLVALALDAFGSFGLPANELSVPRVLGACLVGCGLVLTKL